MSFKVIPLSTTHSSYYYPNYAHIFYIFYTWINNSNKNSEILTLGLLFSKSACRWLLYYSRSLFYSTQRKEWSDEDIYLLEGLILSQYLNWRGRRHQELCHHSTQPLTLPTVIRRFCSPDYYWCYVFERAVKNYAERSSNIKNLEYRRM